MICPERSYSVGGVVVLLFAAVFLKQGSTNHLQGFPREMVE
jgi:hypothetical protein